MDEKKLLELIEGIKNRELELLNIFDERTELGKKVALLENTEKVKIAEELDPATGKPMYSNELKRSNKLEDWKDNDKDYNHFVTKIKALEKKINLEKIELEFDKNKFSMYRILSRMVGE